MIGEPFILSTDVVLEVPVTSPAKVEEVPSLLLKVFQFVDERYPSVVVLACLIVSAGAVVPLVTPSGAETVT